MDKYDFSIQPINSIYDGFEHPLKGNLSDVVNMISFFPNKLHDKESHSNMIKKSL